MRDKKVTFIVQAAVIAALYVVLTFVANALGLASHTIQVRFSEALCILPVFTPAAIPGLWIGCLLANLLTGAVIYDVIFGSIATLLAAVCTYLLRNHKIACTFPPVIFNMIIVPFVLVYAYGIPAVYFHGVNVTIPFNAMTVGIGEVISVCVLGSILMRDTCKNTEMSCSVPPHNKKLYLIEGSGGLCEKTKDFFMRPFAYDTTVVIFY